MTDQDNLRNRIAEVIAGEEEHPHPRGYTAHAQAVIDEFGMTVELRAERVMASPDPLEFDYTRRVVGKWEKQCPH